MAHQIASPTQERNAATKNALVPTFLDSIVNQIVMLRSFFANLDAMEQTPYYKEQILGVSNALGVLARFPQFSTKALAKGNDKQVIRSAIEILVQKLSLLCMIFINYSLNNPFYFYFYFIYSFIYILYFDLFL